MIESNSNKKALLIGNGVNLIVPEQSISWGALLGELKNNFEIPVDLNNEFKPFPLGFEEMLHLKDGSNDFKSKLKNLKYYIRRSIEDQLSNKKGFNEYHRRLMFSKADEILTTNYDYALQKSVHANFMTIKNKLAENKQEQKFSLKRRYSLIEYNKRIWHIHGELQSSRNLKQGSKNYSEESIMIGYEHYTAYLERIQEVFKGKSGTQKAENQSLLSRIKYGNSGEYWIDFLFTHHVSIIGQGFDFSENHLWWLINQRANLIRNTDRNSEVLINNEIVFYYPEIANNSIIDINLKEKDFFNKAVRKRNAIEKSKAIAQVLKALKVNPKPIECENYIDFYENVIKLI